MQIEFHDSVYRFVGCQLRNHNDFNRRITFSYDLTSIYPNPNYGVFFIKVANPAVTASASTSDISGKLIGVYTLNEGDNKIENEKLSAGIYIVTLNLDGNTEFR